MKVEPLSGWNCLRFEQSKQKLSNLLEQLLALYFSAVQYSKSKNAWKNENTMVRFQNTVGNSLLGSELLNGSQRLPIDSILGKKLVKMKHLNRNTDEVCIETIKLVAFGSKHKLNGRVQNFIFFEIRLSL